MLSMSVGVYSVCNTGLPFARYRQEFEPAPRLAFKFENRAFCPWRNGKGRSRGGHGRGGQAVKVVIVVSGIMMEWHKVFDLGQLREGQGMRKGAMAPTNAMRIFRTAILGIMDEEISVRSDRVS